METYFRWRSNISMLVDGCACLLLLPTATGSAWRLIAVLSETSMPVVAPLTYDMMIKEMQSCPSPPQRAPMRNLVHGQGEVYRKCGSVYPGRFPSRAHAFAQGSGAGTMLRVNGQGRGSDFIIEFACCKCRPLAGPGQACQKSLIATTQVPCPEKWLDSAACRHLMASPPCPPCPAPEVSQSPAPSLQSNPSEMGRLSCENSKAVAVAPAVTPTGPASLPWMHYSRSLVGRCWCCQVQTELACREAGARTRHGDMTRRRPARRHRSSIRPSCRPNRRRSPPKCEDRHSLGRGRLNNHALLWLMTWLPGPLQSPLPSYQNKHRP